MLGFEATAGIFDASVGICCPAVGARSDWSGGAVVRRASLFRFRTKPCRTTNEAIGKILPTATSKTEVTKAKGIDARNPNEVQQVL